VHLEPGSRVLVTGASSGIGAELAVRLAGRGVTVGLVARRADRLAEVLERCRRDAPDSRSWVADLGELDRAEALATEAWDTLGHLDAVVHNAGIPLRRHAPELTPADVERPLRVNYLAPVRMTLAHLPRMLARGQGSIVYVSSLAGRVGVPREAAYSASKFALCGWAESLLIDLDGSGVEVRLVQPGAISTEIWDQPDNDDPIYNGPLEPAGDVADGIIAAIEGDRFERYVPDLRSIVEFKTADPDSFLAGAADMARAALAGEDFGFGSDEEVHQP
jgi:short-subunit dehydrogenase